MDGWGEIPWISQKDVSVRMRFGVGRKECEGKVEMKKGKVVQEEVQKLFNKEDVPLYLQASLMDAVMRVVREVEESGVSGSEDVIDVSSLIESSRLLSRHYAVTTSFPAILESSFAHSEEMTWSLKPSNFPDSTGSSGASTFSSLRDSSPSPYTKSIHRPHSEEMLDAKKIIASSVSRGSRTPEQSLHLAKMYHFLVAGDHSVTFDAQPNQEEETRVLKPIPVSLPTPSQSPHQRYYRKRRQIGGAELMLIQDTTNEFREMISQLEHSLAASMAQLIHAKEVAIAALSEKHAKEMERVSQSRKVDFGDFEAKSPSATSKYPSSTTSGRAMSPVRGEVDVMSADRIPSIVERQLSDMEGLEAKWQVELADAEKRQRREYYAFCSDLYRNREKYLQDKKALGPQQLAAMRQRMISDGSIGGGLTAGLTGGLTGGSVGGALGGFASFASFGSQDASSASKRFLSGSSWTSLIFGKASSTSSTSSNGDKVIRVAGHNESLLMAREMTHSEQATYSIVVMLGSQLKVPFEVQVYGGGGMLSEGNVGRVSSLTPTQLHSTSQSSSDSIYSSSLTAIILMTDPQMQCNSPTYNHFFSLTSLSTELHFESAKDQIDLTRAQILPSLENQQSNDIQSSNFQPNQSSNFQPNLSNQSNQSNQQSSSNQQQPSSKLQSGDFFVTTHSNLGKVQVVFHMVGERQNVAQSWPQLLAGLKNILTVASHYDITTLSLPILLVEPEFRHLYSDGQGIKRAEEVVRTIRSFLVLHSASGSSLKTIRLVCPPQSSSSLEDPNKASDVNMFEKLKSTVSTLFNQPLH